MQDRRRKVGPALTIRRTRGIARGVFAGKLLDGAAELLLLELRRDEDQVGGHIESHVPAPYASNHVGLSIELQFATKLDAKTGKWALDLCKRNMQQVYNDSGYSWCDADKKEELLEHAPRQALAEVALWNAKRDRRGAGAPRGLVHRRNMVDGALASTILAVGSALSPSDLEQAGIVHSAAAIILGSRVGGGDLEAYEMGGGGGAADTRALLDALALRARAPRLPLAVHLSQHPQSRQLRGSAHLLESTPLRVTGAIDVLVRRKRHVRVAERVRGVRAREWRACVGLRRERVLLLLLNILIERRVGLL